MADGAIPQELKSSLDAFQGTLATMRGKMDELEKQTKKGAEDAVTKAELKKVETAYDKLKDDINALVKSQRRQLVAAEQSKSSEIETKANLEVATWIGADGDLAKGAANDHAHGQVDDVALDGEFTKFLHHSHGSFPFKTTSPQYHAIAVFSIQVMTARESGGWFIAVRYNLRLSQP